MAHGLAVTLGDEPDLDVVGVARDGAQAEELAPRARPDVVLTDFHLPDGSGAEFARAVRRRLPQVRVLMLSADNDEERVAEAVAAGAVGYMIKTESAEGVADGIRRAAAGEILLPAGALARLIGVQRRTADARAERQRVLATLTPRQREVLRLIARGADSRKIAEELGVAVNTVRGYTQELLEKLEVHSKLEAVARAGELGLLGDDAVAPAGRGPRPRP